MTKPLSKRICTIYLHTGLICFHFEMELIYHLLLSVERLTFDFDSSIEREKGNRISFQIADSQNIQNWLESVGNTTHDNLRIFCSFSTLQTDGINTRCRVSIRFRWRVIRYGLISSPIHKGTVVPCGNPISSDSL